MRGKIRNQKMQPLSFLSLSLFLPSFLLSFLLSNSRKHRLELRERVQGLADLLQLRERGAWFLFFGVFFEEGEKSKGKEKNARALSWSPLCYLALFPSLSLSLSLSLLSPTTAITRTESSATAPESHAAALASADGRRRGAPGYEEGGGSCWSEEESIFLFYVSAFVAL